MNPLKARRESLHLTQKQLAELAGVTPHAVLRYEQGLYIQPSVKILNALSGSAHEYSVLWQAYHEWRDTRQHEAAEFFKPLPQLAVHLHEPPFATFRKTVTSRAVGKESLISFCILLAIHPDVVTEYEKKGTHMPRLIREALSAALVPDRFIESLDQLGVIYNDRRIK